MRSGSKSTSDYMRGSKYLFAGEGVWVGGGEREHVI